MSGYWAVVPAAGSGTRMNASLPKQYLPLLGRPLIECTLERLASVPEITGIMVAIAGDDVHWSGIRLPAHVEVLTVSGGAERHLSVLNALRALRGRVPDNDWVLVHDAARPCVHPDDIRKLISSLRDHPVGGLLGIPVADTMKRVEAGGAVTGSVDRAGLWHALTPQMFRLRALIEAIERAGAGPCAITDEASAVEYTGLRPLMVAGRRDNIKVTTAGDLKLAEQFLRSQEEEGT